MHPQLLDVLLDVIEDEPAHVSMVSRPFSVLRATPAGLGRCLVAMGAPHGAKTSLSAVPASVWESPEPIRCRFVEVYVAHRGAHFETKATTRVQEERPASYLEDLHALIGECVDGNVSVGDRAVTISADAARELGLS